MIRDPIGMLRRYLAELKRRRVIRVAVVYGVAAFAVLQVADIVAPALGFPGWTMGFLVVLAILGFPVAVALAWAFDLTAEGMVRTPEAGEPEPGGTERISDAKDRSPRIPVKSGTFVLGIVVALSLAWLGGTRIGGDAHDITVDENLVAVLPFRVAGAGSEIRYLREGMVDLLAAKLTGEWGPRAVDPRTMMVRWRQLVSDENEDLSSEAAAAMARDLGAGHVILGEVVSAPGRIVLSASLVESRTARASAPVSMEGPPDSLTVLVDRLAAGLLTREAGEPQHRLDGLTSTSLPALRAYLAAHTHYRNGLFTAAERGFEQALALDSTFALAGMGQRQAAGWTLTSGEVDGLQVAWSNRDRLSPRDRAYLEALAGPNYPEPPTLRDRVEAWERVVARSPEDAEAWYQLGDVYFHHPWLAGERTMDRAATAFERVMELDPNYAPALFHMVDLALMGRVAGSVEDHLDRSLAVDSTAGYNQYLMAQIARFRHGPEAEQDFRELLAGAEYESLLGFGMVMAAPWLLEGYPWPEVLETSAFSLELARGLAGTGEERREVARMIRQLALNRGRSGEALQALEDLRLAGASELEILYLPVEDALYWDGSWENGASAAEALSVRLGPPEGWPDRIGDDAFERALCALHHWHLTHEESRGIPTAVRALREGGVGSRLCGEVLEAWATHVNRSPVAPERLAALDALLDQGPNARFHFLRANLALARILEDRGDIEGALRAVRRENVVPGYLGYQSTYLRLQAHLAARLGEREFAEPRYRTYLEFVEGADPDSRAAETAEEVRAEWAQLTQQSGR